MNYAKIFIFIIFLLSLSSFASATVQEDLYNRCEVYYPMEDVASPMVDSVGNVDSTCSNCPSFSVVYEGGVIGDGMEYASSNSDIFTAEANTVFSSGTDDYTMCAWIAKKNSGDNIYPIGQWSASVKYAMQLNDNQRPAGWIAYESAANRVYTIGNNGDISPTGWNFFCMVRNASGYNPIFINATDRTDTEFLDSNPNIVEDSITFGYGGGAYNSFYVDEFSYYSVALNQSHIDYLYNAGSPGADQQYPFGYGGSSPDVTIAYPEESVSYNASWTHEIRLETDINADCSINYTTSSVSDGLTHNFTFSTYPDQNYTVAYSCNSTTYWTNSSFWFFYDGNSPQSTLINPVDGSTKTEDFNLDMSFTDPYLYAVNVSIINSTGDTLFYYSSGAITNGTTTIGLNNLFNISGIENGTVLTLFRESTDSHTIKQFKEEINIIKDTKSEIINKNIYKLNHTDFEITYPKELSISTVKTTDRFKFEYTSETIRGETYFDIYAEKLVRLKNSDYQGHFIVYGGGLPRYWFDTEGLKQTKIIKLDNNRYRIYYLQTDKTEKSNSLGGLNYINWTTTFTVNRSYIGNSVNLNLDSGVLKGYCKFSDFDYGAYEYTLFKDGVNYTSGIALTNGTFTYNQEVESSVTGIDLFWNDSENVYDEDWSTYGIDNGGSGSSLIVNYNQSYVLSAIWRLKTQDGVETTSVPAGCFEERPISFKIYSVYIPGKVYGRCYDYSIDALSSKIIEVNTNAKVYEENITITANYSGYSMGAEINVLNETSDYGLYVFSCRALHATNTTEKTAWLNSSLVSVGDIDISIYNEQNLSYMNLDGIDTVRLDVFSADRIRKIKINESVTTDVRIYEDTTYINLWFIYNSTTSYYRTLIPSDDLFGGNTTLDFYMINLLEDSAVLWDVGLLDLLGQYTNQPFFVTKLTDKNGTIEIIRQLPDIENYVHLYLIKDETYALNIYQDDGTLRVIGNIEASGAAQKVATLAPIDFKPSTYLSKDVALGADLDKDTGLLRITYGDSSGLTESVQITVYNGSDTTQVLTQYNSTAQNFTYSYPSEGLNESYILEIEYCHQIAGCLEKRVPFGSAPKIGAGKLDFSWMFKNSLTANSKKAIGLLVIVGTALLFPAEYVLVGVIVLFFELFTLNAFRLLDISLLTGSIFTLMLVLTIIRGVLKDRK